MKNEEYEIHFRIKKKDMRGKNKHTVNTYPRCPSSIHSGFVSSILVLHRATAPAVRAAAKTQSIAYYLPVGLALVSNT